MVINPFCPSLKVVGLAGDAVETACKNLGLAFLAEGFMDRSYLPNSNLLSRSEKGPVFEDQLESIGQAIALATNKHIIVIDPFINSVFSHNIFTKHSKVLHYQTIQHFIDSF